MAVERKQTSSLLIDIALYAASAVISFVLLNNVLKKLDPNHENAKQAQVKKKELSKRLGRPLLDTNQYEDIIACDVVNPNHISVTFDSIGGLENIKQALARDFVQTADGAVHVHVPDALAWLSLAQHDLVILPLVRPELFARGKLLTPTKGVLLYGPPGTGKTMIAKALAKESGACFLNVRSAALQSKWFGDAQKLVTAVFTLAWKIQPCVIFIDEIDSFLGSRKSSEHEAVTSMKTEFMALWDGFLTDNNARVLVLAATNRPWDIDEAILRRLPRAFEVPLPDASQRKRILSVLIRGEDVDDTLWADRDGALDRLALATEGYSGSDLQDLCKQAAMLPIHDLLEEERAAVAAGVVDLPAREPRPLTAEDLFAVLEVRLSGLHLRDESFHMWLMRHGLTLPLFYWVLSRLPRQSSAPPSAEAAAAYHRSVMMERQMRYSTPWAAGAPASGRGGAAPPRAGGGPAVPLGADTDLAALMQAILTMTAASTGGGPAPVSAPEDAGATSARAGAGEWGPDAEPGSRSGGGGGLAPGGISRLRGRRRPGASQAAGGEGSRGATSRENDANAAWHDAQDE